MSGNQKKGILKVFLSSTFRDLHQMRGQLLDRLVPALEGAAMEKFISTGEGPQTVALKELNNSDIAVFLISPYYGTDIQCCEFETCKAECGMKKGEEKISYTWCEYRVALGENMPHVSYIVDENWYTVSKDGAPKLWDMRKEVEKEYCPRIKNDDEGVQKVVTDLAEKIVDWYSDGTINFEKFCGRRDLLKDLFCKMRKSVNVHGVGGIGKTTVCEVALLIYTLLGRKIVYCGYEEAYASGTGYEFASEKLTPYRVPDLTIDDIVEVMGLGDALKEVDQKTKVDTILKWLDRKGAILFIDNITENDLKELLRRGNTLSRGCILASSKKEVETAFYRIPVEGIEEKERGNLVEIIASRMRKKIGKEEQERIEEIAEGNPIATYLLVSNIGRVNIENLENFKEGLDFSRENDVQEYMNRVIERSISTEAYDLLKNLSVIEEEIDIDSMYEAFLRFSYSKEIAGELLDASIIERRGNTFAWKYSQIRDAVFEDIPERHSLAGEYFKRKVEKYGDVKDGIEMLYHMTKVEYTDEILGTFVELANTIKGEDPVMRQLPKLGEEIKNHVKNENKALICRTLGNVYWNISNYKDKAVNCKKAITDCKEALKVCTFEDFPMGYATTQNNLGNAYSILAEVEDKAVNCKKAITAYKEALKVRTFEDFPMDYATTQNNLGNAYSTLAEVEDKAVNCKKAITAYKEALKVYTFEDFPMDYATTQNNLGNAYKTLAEVEDKASNCKKAITACNEALKVRTFEDFPMDYATTQNNLGNAYSTLAEVEDKAVNCKKAITAHKEALKVRTFEDFPMGYATTQNNLGTAYKTLAEVEDKASNCKKAITACNEALKVYTFEDFPMGYATTQNNLGNAYKTLAEVEDKAVNCKKAITAYKEALKIFKKEKSPEVHKIVEQNLKILLDFCKDQ